MNVRSFTIAGGAAVGNQVLTLVPLEHGETESHYAIVPGNAYRCNADVADGTPGLVMRTVKYGILNTLMFAWVTCDPLRRNYTDSDEFYGEINPVPRMPDVPAGD